MGAPSSPCTPTSQLLHLYAFHQSECLGSAHREAQRISWLERRKTNTVYVCWAPQKCFEVHSEFCEAAAAIAMLLETGKKCPNGWMSCLRYDGLQILQLQGSACSSSQYCYPAILRNPSEAHRRPWAGTQRLSEPIFANYSPPKQHKILSESLYPSHLQLVMVSLIEGALTTGLEGVLWECSRESNVQRAQWGWVGFDLGIPRGHFSLNDSMILQDGCFKAKKEFCQNDQAGQGGQVWFWWVQKNTDLSLSKESSSGSGKVPV